MSIICFDSGAAQLAGFGVSNAAGFLYDLYKSNTTPAHGDSIGAYTLCDYPGYAQQSGGGWANGVGSAGAQTSTGPQKTFTATAADGQVIYGFIVRNAGGLMLFGGLFPGGPYPIGGVGAGVQFSPTLSVSY